MRGKAKHTHAFQFRHRITPACAGKRLCLTCVLAILWDHPRMCGEKWLARFKPFATRGSPPHVRGKGVVHILVPEPLGITPAYAGKRDLFPAGKTAPRDHPRMCGEKLFAFLVFCPNIGSPPHVRGKEGKEYLQETESRITPACAGKSVRTCTLLFSPWDHPRMCGEKLTRKSAINCGSGSPPHVRGKDANKVLWMEKFRITPACAGKSHRRSNLHVQQGDHPRMCGEKSLLPSSPSQRMGSPPHVRGKAVKLAQYFDVTGITPACAGKSPSFRMISNKNGDHPRMCGEKLTMVHPCLRLKGSPPHVRGKD